MKREAIAEEAVKEHEAWAARNKARREYRAFLSDYVKETGDWFDRECADPDLLSPYQELKAAAALAQRALTAARARTRRAIKREMEEAAK